MTATMPSSGPPVSGGLVFAQFIRLLVVFVVGVVSVFFEVLYARHIKQGAISPMGLAVAVTSVAGVVMFASTTNARVRIRALLMQPVSAVASPLASVAVGLLKAPTWLAIAATLLTCALASAVVVGRAGRESKTWVAWIVGLCSVGPVLLSVPAAAGAAIVAGPVLASRAGTAPVS